MANENESQEITDTYLSKQSAENPKASSVSSGIYAVLENALNDAITNAVEQASTRYIHRDQSKSPEISAEISENIAKSAQPGIRAGLSEIGIPANTVVNFGDKRGTMTALDIVTEVLQNFSYNIVHAMLRLGPPASATDEKDSSDQISPAQSTYADWMKHIVDEITSQVNVSLASGKGVDVLLANIKDAGDRLANFTPNHVKYLLTHPESISEKQARKAASDLEKNSQLINALQVFLSVIDLYVSGLPEEFYQFNEVVSDISSEDFTEVSQAMVTEVTNAIQVVQATSKANAAFESLLSYYIIDNPDKRTYKIPDMAVYLVYYILSQVKDGTGNPVISQDQFDKFKETISKYGRLAISRPDADKAAGRLGYPELRKQLMADLFKAKSPEGEDAGTYDLVTTTVDDIFGTSELDETSRSNWELKAAPALGDKSSKYTNAFRYALGVSLYGLVKGDAVTLGDPNKPRGSKTDVPDFKIKPSLYDLIRLFSAYANGDINSAAKFMIDLARSDKYSADVLVEQIKRADARTIQAYGLSQPSLLAGTSRQKISDSMFIESFRKDMLSLLESEDVMTKVGEAKRQGELDRREAPAELKTEFPRAEVTDDGKNAASIRSMLNERLKAIRDFKAAPIARQYADESLRVATESILAKPTDAKLQGQFKGWQSKHPEVSFELPEVDLGSIPTNQVLGFLGEVSKLSQHKLREALRFFLLTSPWGSGVRKLSDKPLAEIVQGLRTTLGPVFNSLTDYEWSNIAREISKNKAEPSRPGSITRKELYGYASMLSDIMKDISNQPLLLRSAKFAGLLVSCLTRLFPPKLLAALGFSEGADISNEDAQNLPEVYKTLMSVLSDDKKESEETGVSAADAAAAVKELDAQYRVEKGLPPDAPVKREPMSGTDVKHNEMYEKLLTRGPDADEKKKAKESKEENMTEENKPNPEGPAPIQTESAVLSRNSEFDATNGPWELHQEASGKKKFKKRDPKRISKISRYLGGAAYSSFVEGDEVLYTAEHTPLSARVAAVSPDGLYEIVVESGDVYSNVPEADLVATDGTENIFE